MVAVFAPTEWVREQARQLDEIRRAQRALALQAFAEECRDLCDNLTHAVGEREQALIELAEYDADVQERSDSGSLTDADTEYLTRLPEVWLDLCEELRSTCGLLDGMGRSHRADATGRNRWDVAFAEVRSELIELLRSLQIGHPELALDVPADLVRTVWTVRIPWWSYLRAMWTMYWSAILHPLSDTTIDLSTGRIVYRT